MDAVLIPSAALVAEPLYLTVIITWISILIAALAIAMISRLLRSYEAAVLGIIGELPRIFLGMAQYAVACSIIIAEAWNVDMHIKAVVANPSNRSNAVYHLHELVIHAMGSALMTAIAVYFLEAVCLGMMRDSAGQVAKMMLEEWVSLSHGQILKMSLLRWVWASRHNESRAEAVSAAAETIYFAVLTSEKHVRSSDDQTDEPQVVVVESDVDTTSSELSHIGRAELAEWGSP